MKPYKPAPRRALKKLLDRIRSQRNQWTEHNSHVPAADSPTAITDEIPERDTTIDTGSLTSEEKNKESPIELPEPADSPPGRSFTVINCNNLILEDCAQCDTFAVLMLDNLEILCLLLFLPCFHCFHPLPLTYIDIIYI